MAASDYLLPSGRLHARLLPQDDLSAYIAAWEAEATVQAGAAGLTGDAATAAVAAYVYWRGYTAAAEAMLAEANSLRAPNGAQRTFDRAQYAYFTSQAAHYGRAWHEAIDVIAATLRSQSAPLAVQF